MTLPSDMYALTLAEGGYTESTTSIGPYLDKLEPFIKGQRVAVPQPGDGQVLVKTRLAAINPSDIHFIKGEYGLPREAGAIPGFEGCGDVIAAGKGAEGFVGHRVAFVGSGAGTGTWAEYSVQDAAGCVPVPEAVRDEDAAAFFVNPLTAVAMVTIAKETGSGSVIMTAGASQLAKLMIPLAKDMGLNAIAIVRRDDCEQELKNLGAAHVLNCKSSSFTRDFQAVSGAEKPRILLDAVVDKVSADMFFAMPNRARWLIYGLLDSKPKVLDQMGQLVFTGKKIEGFWLSNWIVTVPDETRTNAVMQVIDRFSKGTWKTDVRLKIPFSKAHKMLPSELSKPNTGKLMFTSG
jgi:NADPH:quinone reductase-like Zn-dependent oxidoreductase